MGKQPKAKVKNLQTGLEEVRADISDAAESPGLIALHEIESTRKAALWDQTCMIFEAESRGLPEVAARLREGKAVISTNAVQQMLDTPAVRAAILALNEMSAEINERVLRDKSNAQFLETVTTWGGAVTAVFGAVQPPR